jgi:hypothetical protein
MRELQESLPFERQDTNPILRNVRLADGKVDTFWEIGRKVIDPPVLAILVLMQGMVWVGGETMPEFSRSLQEYIRKVIQYLIRGYHWSHAFSLTLSGVPILHNSRP